MSSLQMSARCLSELVMFTESCRSERCEKWQDAAQMHDQAKQSPLHTYVGSFLKGDVANVKNGSQQRHHALHMSVFKPGELEVRHHFLPFRIKGVRQHLL